MRLILMESPQSTSSHMYSQSLQLKHYQAFIFSIPILFSIILFLFFYLFYLKKSSSPPATPRAILPIRSNEASFFSSLEIISKRNHKEKLEVVLFNEDSQTRDSACCVCLGDFEVGEELHRIAMCKHVFHIDCICYWLHSNPTCPLCRCFLTCTAKHSRGSQPIYGPPNPARQVVNRNPIFAVSPQQRERILPVPTEMAYIL